MMGTKFVYELKPGEKWAVYEGLLVVVHPDRPPKVVYEDGSEELLRPRVDGRVFVKAGDGK